MSIRPSRGRGPGADSAGGAGQQPGRDWEPMTAAVGSWSGWPTQRVVATASATAVAAVNCQVVSDSASLCSAKRFATTL